MPGSVTQTGTASGGAQVYQAGRDLTVQASPLVPRVAPTWPVRFGVVPARAGFFQSRDLSAPLVSQREQGDTVVLGGAGLLRTRILVGLGGVGKTQLAADHAHRVWTQRQVDLIAWIQAGSSHDVRLGYAEMDAWIQDHDPDASGAQGDPVIRLLNWLATTPRRWLVVLDDLVEPSDLRGLWPPSSPTGQVLVTTRRRDAALSGDRRDVLDVLDVGTFTDSEALGYLVERLPERAGTSEEQGELRGLATELGRLPLALAQAAAYLADRPQLSCSDYRRRLGDLRTGLAGVLPEERELPDEQYRTVITTWSLSIEFADRLRPAGVAKPLLELMSVLDPAGIPAKLFATSAISLYLERRLKRPVDPGAVQDAVGCLYRLSLLSSDHDQPARAVRVHALVQRVTRDALGTADLRAIARTVGQALLEIRDAEGYELRTSVRSNSDALLQHGRVHLWASSARRLLMLVADDRAKQGLYNGSYLGELLDEAMWHFDVDHPDTIAIRDRLAACHAEAGEFDRAAEQAEHLLATRLRLLGADHVDTLTTRRDLALWHTRAGQPNEALAELEQLVSAQIRLLGPVDETTSRSRLERAVVRCEAGDPAVATTELEELLADQVVHFGPEHRASLYTRAHLINARTLVGQHARAVAEFEQLVADRSRQLALCESVIPTLHGFVTASYDDSGKNNGWKVCRADLVIEVAGIPFRNSYKYLLGRYDHLRNNAPFHPTDAIGGLTELLTESSHTWGGQSPLPIVMRNDLATWLEWSGDVLGAVVERELLLADQLRVYGADHPDVRATRKQLRQLDKKVAKLSAVRLWQRRRERRTELDDRGKRPRKWPDRAPVDEALRRVRAELRNREVP